MPPALLLAAASFAGAASAQASGRPSLSPVYGFPPAARGKDEHGVQFRDIPIKGHLASEAAADDQFAQLSRRGSVDEGVGLEDVERRDDFADSSRRPLDVALRKVIQDPIEVVANLRRDADARHRYRRSFLAAGRRGRLPTTRLSRQARISL